MLTNETSCFQILRGKCESEEFISLKLMVRDKLKAYLNSEFMFF